MSNVHSGSSTYLWDDMWNGLLPKLHFPELHSYARNKCLSVQKARSLTHFHSIFHIPLSDETFNQFTEFQNMLLSLPTSTENDVLTYIWGPDFSCSKAYRHLKGHIETPPVYKWLWKSCCQLKHKTFF
jgi:hypothetical protein